MFTAREGSVGYFRDGTCEEQPKTSKPTKIDICSMVLPPPASTDKFCKAPPPQWLVNRIDKAWDDARKIQRGDEARRYLSACRPPPRSQARPALLRLGRTMPTCLGPNTTVTTTLFPP